MDAALPDLSLDDLSGLLRGWGEPAFRAEQIWRATYQDFVSGYETITPLPKALRKRLAERLPFDAVERAASEVSRDGATEKALFRLRDGETIETVLMQYDRRRTVCVSTQVGCAIGCPFCATGMTGLRRNLAPGEIVGQVLHFARQLAGQEERVTNIVYMGMGEPLLNYEATLASIRTLNDPSGFGLRARAFTVSTAGVAPGIERLAAEPLQVNLAVSLHAANDRLRNRLVPLNRRYLLSEVLHACRAYVGRTHRRVTFEVALIDGLNDSPQDARELAGLLAGLQCHVNVIGLNPVDGCALRPSPRRRREAFVNELRRLGIPVTLRLGRGIDVRAGCGQLRSRSLATGPDVPGA